MRERCADDRQTGIRKRRKQVDVHTVDVTNEAIVTLRMDALVRTDQVAVGPGKTDSVDSARLQLSYERLVDQASVDHRDDA